METEKEITNHPINKETVKRITESAWKNKKPTEISINYFANDIEKLEEKISKIKNGLNLINETNNIINSEFDNIGKLAIYMFFAHQLKQPMIWWGEEKKKYVLDNDIIRILEDIRHQTKNLLKDKIVWQVEGFDKHYEKAKEVLKLTENDLEKAIELVKVMSK